MDNKKKTFHLVFLQEFWCDGPWGIPNDFIYISVVSDPFIPFPLIHNCVAFISVSQLVVAN